MNAPLKNPAWLTPAPTALYAQRRARLAAQMTQLGGPDAIAIIPTAPERMRNRDSDYLFRFDSYFHYLSGFAEPNAWLLIDGKGHTTLFCQPKDLEREIWDGIRLGPDAAPQALGVDAAYSVAELEQRLPKLLENQATVWYPSPRTPGWRHGSTAGSRPCAPACATARFAPRPSGTSARCSMRCASSRTSTNRT